MKREKIKVIHVVNDIKVGGVSVVLFDLLSQSKSSPFLFEIVNLSGVIDKQLKEMLFNLDIRVHNLTYKFEEDFSLISQFKKAIFKRKYFEKNKEIINYISKLKPTILHFHSLPRELMIGQFVAKTEQCKLIYTDHLARVKLEEIKWISKFLLKWPLKSFYKGYYVIAVGQPVESYIKTFGIDSVLVGLKIIQNKIKRSDTRINYLFKSEINIVYVARISSVKGHWDLINAWMLIPKLGLHLYIVGPDEMEGKVQKYVSENVFQNKITFTGSISNVKDFIEKMDIGVFPSYKEGLPIALLEKMQIGLPCIVSDIAELSVIINDGYDGLVFKLGNTAELASSISKLALDLKLRKYLGQNASKTIEGNFVSKLGGIDKEYELVYEELLKKH